jgi:hypothetical protein
LTAKTVTRDPDFDAVVLETSWGPLRLLIANGKQPAQRIARLRTTKRDDDSRL